jgi:membrane protein implicated in regulation of membrane protease activity
LFTPAESTVAYALELRIARAKVAILNIALILFISLAFQIITFIKTSHLTLIYKHKLCRVYSEERRATAVCIDETGAYHEQRIAVFF